MLSLTRADAGTLARLNDVRCSLRRLTLSSSSLCRERSSEVSLPLSPPLFLFSHAPRYVSFCCCQPPFALLYSCFSIKRAPRHAILNCMCLYFCAREFPKYVLRCSCWPSNILNSLSRKQRFANVRTHSMRLGDLKVLSFFSQFMTDNCFLFAIIFILFYFIFLFAMALDSPWTYPLGFDSDGTELVQRPIAAYLRRSGTPPSLRRKLNHAYVLQHE